MSHHNFQSFSVYICFFIIIFLKAKESKDANDFINYKIIIADKSFHNDNSDIFFFHDGNLSKMKIFASKKKKNIDTQTMVS